MPFVNAVQELHVDMIRALCDARKKRLSALKTKEDARRYVEHVRRAILKSFHLPTVKTPLNPVVFNEFCSEGLLIRNVRFESRTGYPVTATLFRRADLPRGRKTPGVLFLCGHAGEGRRSNIYQTCCLNLADQGFTVLAVDPVSQGERLQFRLLSSDIPMNCCFAHNLMGKQLIPTGDYMGAWRAWDGVRALDYLLSLPEVDARRVGVTGNSGGGTMTTFLCALDPRPAMAAPGCYITTWRREIENELPADAEQMPPFIFRSGLEMSDFIIARAPRPVLILGQKNDFFDPRGTLEAFEDIRRVYRLLGAADNVKCFIGPRSHGYFLENREAMYSFFNRQAGLRTGETAVRENPAIKPLPPEQLSSTPGGQVDTLPGNRFMQELIREKADQLAARRKALTKEELRKVLAQNLKTGRIGVPAYRKLRYAPGKIGNGTVLFSRFGIESEPGRVMAVLKRFDTDHIFNYIEPSGEVLLHIPHLDAAKELIALPKKEGQVLYGLDVRGIGELMPDGCDQDTRDFFAAYNFDYHYAALGFMFGRPFLGGKVRDILCTAAMLKSEGVGKIRLSAEGLGTVPALLAAVLSDDIESVHLNGLPESWDSMLRKKYTLWPMSCMLYGVLEITDIPELCRHVKNLTIGHTADEPV